MFHAKSAEFLSVFIARGLAYFFMAIFSGYIQASLAKRLGDDTAEEHGFLTLNPFVYIDPIGFFAFLMTGFGWGQQVPIDPRNFSGKYKRLELVATYAIYPFALSLVAVMTLFLLVAFLGGATLSLPMPGFFVDHYAITHALRMIIGSMVKFGIFFVLFNALLTAVRLGVLYLAGRANMLWHVAEMSSLALALLLVLFFAEALHRLAVDIILFLQLFLWQWWKLILTLSGLISWYR